MTSPASGLASWLAGKPKNATTLALGYSGIVDELVRRWPADELGTSLMDASQGILLVAQEDCDARGEACDYIVTWEDDGGRPLSNRHVRLTPMTLAHSGDSQNPMMVVWDQMLKYRGREHALNQQLVLKVLEHQTALIHELATERRDMAKLLLETLQAKVGPVSSSGEDDSLSDQVKAAALERLANLATDTLVPILGQAAEQRLLAASTRKNGVKRKVAPNGQSSKEGSE